MSRRPLTAEMESRPDVKPTTQNLAPLLTVKDAARVLAVSEKTIRRMIDAGELPVVRFRRQVRLHAKDLELFVRTHRES